MNERRKILIVDDYEESCRLLSEILGEEYQATYISDSTQAFSKINEFHPDLVILLMSALDSIH